MATIQFGFKAIKPITAWHDEQEVTFQPGDEVPANEWKGAAVEALIENGKLMRYATNVYEAGEFGGEALATQVRSVPMPDDRDELVARIADLERLVARLSGEPVEEEGGSDGSGTGENAPFPRGPDGGFYELSDGSRVKGKAKALAAQAELDLAAEGG